MEQINKEKIINEQIKTKKITKQRQNIKKEKCPKCSQEIDSSKFKEHLQTSHLTEIIDHIFLGSYSNAKDFSELEKNNIKYILNCAAECDNIFKDKIKYLKLEIKDQNDFPINEYFEEGIKFIKESISNNDGNILIHCFQGKSRSTTLLMAYLIKYNNEDTNSAYKILKSKRQLTMPNLGFMQKLREYEKEIGNV